MAIEIFFGFEVTSVQKFDLGEESKAFSVVCPPSVSLNSDYSEHY